MKSTQKLFRVFLDTSTLLSGLNSAFGASGYILSLFKAGKIDVVISQEVVVEAERVIKNKFPLLKVTFLDFLTHQPIITKKLTEREIKQAHSLIGSEDAPILAGAIKVNSNYLITLDKDFQKGAQGKTSFEVLSPGEFLQRFRKIKA